jgi:hypothetical protein
MVVHAQDPYRDYSFGSVLVLYMIENLYLCRVDTTIRY